MKALTEVELDKLLTVAREKSESDYLMLKVTFNHGLRVSETLSLTKKNLVNGHLDVQRLKGSKRTRQPLLPNEAYALLKLAASTEGRFFTIDRTTFWRRMRQYGEAAGIPVFKCHPHALKHTTGRLAYKGGMGIPEIQMYLGHVSGSNTMKYMEPDEEEASGAFLKAMGKR
jgi:integrase/recombinase XerD